MKQLTQAVFDDAPDWVKSADVTHSGIAWGFNMTLAEVKAWRSRKGHISEIRFEILGFDYSTRFWHKTKIDREVTK